MVMTGSADAIDSILDEIDSVMYNRIPATPYNSTRDTYPAQTTPASSSSSPNGKKVSSSVVLTRALSNSMGKNTVDASGKRAGTPFVYAPQEGGTIYTSQPPRKTLSTHNVSASIRAAPSFCAPPSSSSSSSVPSASPPASSLSPASANLKVKSKASSDPAIGSKHPSSSSSSSSTHAASRSPSNVRVSPRPSPSSSSPSSTTDKKKNKKYYEEEDSDDGASVIEENYDMNKDFVFKDSTSSSKTKDRYKQPQEGGVDAHLLDDILSEIQSAYS